MACAFENDMFILTCRRDDDKRCDQYITTGRKVQIGEEDIVEMT